MVVSRAIPAQAEAREEPSLAVLPADRPDVRLDLRISDAPEAFQLSDRVPDYRSDHVIAFLVREIPWSHRPPDPSRKGLLAQPLGRPGFVPTS